MERISAEVLLVEGVGPDARAHVATAEDLGVPIRVPAALVVEGTGYALDELAGKRVLALVDGRGELAGFERA